MCLSCVHASSIACLPTDLSMFTSLASISSNMMPTYGARLLTSIGHAPLHEHGESFLPTPFWLWSSRLDMVPSLMFMACRESVILKYFGVSKVRLTPYYTISTSTQLPNLQKPVRLCLRCVLMSPPDVLVPHDSCLGDKVIHRLVSLRGGSARPQDVPGTNLSGCRWGAANRCLIFVPTSACFCSC